MEPPIDIVDENPPLANLPEQEPPALPPAPATDGEDFLVLEDGEIPLGNLPQTGFNHSAMQRAAALTGFGALTAMAGTKKERRE